MNNKFVGWFLIFAGAFLVLIFSVYLVMSYYDFKNNYGSYWELADRSSTLEAKYQYISLFIDQLQKDRERFADYNALFLKTPENNFDNNLNALITLEERLRDIQTMDKNSFEYQTAIHQITAQEQGEAQNLISTIRGCFVLGSYSLVWSWIGMVLTLLFASLTFIGLVGIGVGCNQGR